MPTAENAKLQYEAGQNSVAMTALTDSGDLTTFNSGVSLFSGRSGYAPDVKPDGLATGGVVTVGAGNDNVSGAAATAYLAGVLTSAAVDITLGVTRGVTDGYRINSITIDSSGTLVVVAGTESTAFSETRGAAGGPPYIPVGDIEIAQVRLTSTTAGVVLASEIFAVVGLHQERYDYPLWNENNEAGTVTFLSAIAAIHTGDLAKGVFASYASPIFADINLASDFVPPENSHSVGSTQVYGSTLGSTSTTLGQGAFTAYVNDGVTDALVVLKDETLWFKFLPDRYKAPYVLAQGKLGIARTFPAGDNIQAACTISADTAAIEKAS